MKQAHKLTDVQIDRFRFLIAGEIAKMTGQVVSADIVHEALIRSNDKLEEFECYLDEVFSRKARVK